ncbi:bacillithiol system redox-active protein YtxJ [Robertkochia flava]|uniref:bacillithiol system redox-active protein YtxJ n=1 Tax=Robertkochia flava TaxID=3447986 RepID=UPI001CCE7226|nr:bacillithiol system redox-active protein YtxJ [Robertkochia marina]
MKLFGSFLGSNGDPEKTSLPWEQLQDERQLEQIREMSYDIPVLIYKHSTRCGISSMVLNRLEREYEPGGEGLKPYFIDLIKYRRVSDMVAEAFGVRHESPQILLIKKGEVVYDESHTGIHMGEILKHL